MRAIQKRILDNINMFCIIVLKYIIYKYICDENIHFLTMKIQVETYHHWKLIDFLI